MDDAATITKVKITIVVKQPLVMMTVTRRRQAIYTVNSLYALGGLLPGACVEPTLPKHQP